MVLYYVTEDRRFGYLNTAWPITVLKNAFCLVMEQPMTENKERLGIRKKIFASPQHTNIALFLIPNLLLFPPSTVPVILPAAAVAANYKTTI